ncbi:DUF416 family protein [Cellulomonas cellasea]|uniref:Uncharacterized protein YjaG (DUF416 family) n=1 Tax=Cellulomonas cellasea TaxID=43670 RepID=A0A7W4UG60_9CELL|nr:DUF416 family protein [Cellulomonas cellasea]MBB2923537.1 uncharacterized protein YjaG (DUF416 family) [Cellulomonas cellasea]
MLDHEKALLAELSARPREVRTRFAAACAERLLPLYESASESTDAGDPATLAAALDAVWAAAADGTPPPDLPGTIERLTALVPDAEDEDWDDDHAYLQNGAAVVVYACRVVLDGEVQDALWCARQVHEAADQAAQLLLDEDNTEGAYEAADASPVVRHALDGFDADLALAADTALSWPELARRLRAQARAGGVRLAELARGE